LVRRYSGVRILYFIPKSSVAFRMIDAKGHCQRYSTVSETGTRRDTSPASWWSLRSARVALVHYLGKPPCPSLGATPLNTGVQVLVPNRGSHCLSLNVTD